MTTYSYTTRQAFLASVGNLAHLADYLLDQQQNQQETKEKP